MQFDVSVLPDLSTSAPPRPDVAMQLFFDEKMLDHTNGPRHPERPDRLRAIRRRLEDREKLDWRAPSPVERTWLDAVHAPDYVDRLLDLRGESRQLDADTHLSPASIDAAELAAGAVCEAVDAVCLEGDSPPFAFVRPPGHHAETSRAMGFCLFDNVAIASCYAIEEIHDIERVLVVDWDVHHGNGTQEIFYGDDDVLYFSIHQSPLFPGTGDVEETGNGVGDGHTVNLPMPAGRGDGDYATAFDRLLEPVAESYDPDLICISAGFDAHQRDPLATMEVTAPGFAALCARCLDYADRFAENRMLLTLEGGYDLDGLADSVDACIDVLLGASTPDIDDEPSQRGWDAIADAIEAQTAYWDL